MKMKLLLPVLLGAFIFLPVISQETEAERYTVNDTLADFGLFLNDDILDLSLRFDITTYTRKKPKDEYLDAVLTYHLSKTDSINRNVRLKSRGEFRNQYCDFPPIALNFKGKDPEKNDREKLEKVKLVTHCESGNEAYLLKEYLVYKLFNVLTERSFRVRLARINYINTAKNTKPIRTYAFFIEPVNFLAERINCIPLEVTTLTQRNIVPESIDRMAVFFYMIGNTDWSVPNQHNCKVFADPASPVKDLGLVIPYDFDYTGFVNAHYAVPPEGLGIQNVRQRMYLGMCRDDNAYLNALKEFRDKKDSFYRIINEFTLLNERDRKDLTKFLDEFYAEIEKNNSILKSFANTCKKL
jgi:hypothetical protein